MMRSAFHTESNAYLHSYEINKKGIRARGIRAYGHKGKSEQN